MTTPSKLVFNLINEYGKPIAKAAGERRARPDPSTTLPGGLGGYRRSSGTELEADPGGSDLHLDPDTQQLTSRPVRQSVRQPVNVQREPDADAATWAGKMLRSADVWKAALASVAVYGVWSWVKNATSGETMRARDRNRVELRKLEEARKPELSKRVEKRAQAVQRSSECREICVAEGHKGSALKTCQSDCVDQRKGAANGS